MDIETDSEVVGSGLLPETILFDLDGTLVDTIHITAEAFNIIREIRGHEPISADRLKPYISLGGLELARFALHGALQDLRSDLSLFRRIVGRLSADAGMIYPGVISALERLERANVRLGVVTNKPQALAVPLLETLGLTKYFHCIVGGDTVPHKKPHPAHIEGALKALDMPAYGCVLVGDSEVDAEAAAQSGLCFVHFGGGYCGQELLEEPRHRRFYHFDELLPLLTMPLNQLA